MPLSEASREADAAAVRALLQQHVDVNSARGGRDDRAALGGHLNDLAAVKLLLRGRRQREAANRYGVKPLSLACEAGNAAIVDQLLEAGADANAIAGGDTALMTAARTGNVAVIQRLLAHGADVNATRELARTDGADVGGD